MFTIFGFFFFFKRLWSVLTNVRYADRTNIGNAKIAGMDKDLDLDDSKYAWVLRLVAVPDKCKKKKKMKEY